MVFNFDGEFFEIFSNLPSKSIFKISTVCKDVHKLSLNEVFARKQSLNMQARDDHGFLLQRESCGEINKVELHPLEGQDSDFYGLSSMSLEFLARKVKILSSSNGLVLCTGESNEESGNLFNLFICNPSTHSWLAIPTPDGLNFGRIREQIILDCNNIVESMDFSLMALMEDPDAEWFRQELSVKIFSTREGTWKTIGVIDRGQRETAINHMPIYDSSTETIYILSSFSMGVIDNKNSYYWPYIVCYNTKNFETKFLSIPKDARKGVHNYDCRMKIFKWRRGDLHLVQLNKEVFRVWVLHDNKWVRVLKMRALAMIGRGVKREDNLVRGFTIMNGKSLLFATHEKVYQWNLMDIDYDQKSPRRVADEICEHEFAEAWRVDFYSYSNTLRSCGKGAMSIYS